MNKQVFYNLCINGAKPYKPKVKKSKRAILGSLIIADLILPMTFGLGIILTKLITKYNPLFLYK